MYFALLIRRLRRRIDILHRIRFSRNRIGSFHALSRRFQRLGFNARIGFARFHDRLGFPFGFARQELCSHDSQSPPPAPPAARVLRHTS